MYVHDMPQCILCMICECNEREREKERKKKGSCVMVKVDVNDAQKKSGKPLQYVQWENTSDWKGISLKGTQVSDTTSIV